MTFSLKKMIITLGLSSLLFGTCITNALASDTAILTAIQQNTAKILSAVNNIPLYITQMIQFALNMQMADDSKSTQAMQASFATTGNAIIQNLGTQLTLAPKLNADLLQGATQTNLPFANDLTYSSLAGAPFFNPDPRDRPGAPPVSNFQYNYIKNASAVGITHAAPQAAWRGGTIDYKRYANYYNTVMAAESFGGYALSQQLADAQNNNGLSQAQASLVAQASGSAWIATIASEEIGKVLRQILMFDSQLYVLMTQVLQTQKQLLTAQVINNSLVIAANQMNEFLLVSK